MTTLTHPVLGTLDLSGGAPRQGGQALVWRATTASGQAVAVKRPRAAGVHATALASEITSLVDLHQRRPNASTWLVPVLGHGQDPEGRPFLVLPWYQQSLSDWMKSARHPLIDRLDAARQACEAVHELHHSGAAALDVHVHRDLKLGNFLVETSAGRLQVRLSDLGTTKRRQMHSTTVNTMVLTPGYAPPEQLLPIPQPQSPKLDVYALGVVVVVCLTHRQPEATRNNLQALTSLGRNLLSLAGATTLSPEEEFEKRELESRPPHELLDLESMAGLTQADVSRVIAAVSAELEEHSQTPDADAERLVAPLLKQLRKALDPDTRERLPEVRPLLAAVTQVHRAVGAILAAPSPNTSHEPGRGPVPSTMAVGDELGIWSSLSASPTGDGIRAPQSEATSGPQSAVPQGASAHASAAGHEHAAAESSHPPLPTGSEVQSRRPRSRRLLLGAAMLLAATGLGVAIWTTGGSEAPAKSSPVAATGPSMDPAAARRELASDNSPKGTLPTNQDLPHVDPQVPTPAHPSDDSAPRDPPGPPVEPEVSPKPEAPATPAPASPPAAPPPDLPPLLFFETPRHPGSPILVDGRPLTRTDFREGVSLPPGRHVIELRGPPGPDGTLSDSATVQLRVRPTTGNRWSVTSTAGAAKPGSAGSLLLRWPRSGEPTVGLR